MEKPEINQDPEFLKYVYKLNDGIELSDETLLDAVIAAGTDKTGGSRAINILAASDLPGRNLVNVVARISSAGLKTRLVTLREEKP